MRTLRLLAGLGAAAAVAAAGPAFAGGGAAMTVTASMSGQNGLLPFGSLHTVWVQVTDSTLGEATLEHITVTVTGAAAPVTCDLGPNGAVVLVPGRTVVCGTQITAGAGQQSFTVQATGVVAGGDTTLVRNVVVVYQGSVPTMPAPAPASSSTRAIVVRPSISPLGGGAPPSEALPGGASAMPSTGCPPMPSPGAGPTPAGGTGCADVSPTTSPSTGCAALAGRPAPSGLEDCARASSRGALAFTGTQVMVWGAVALAAVASGVGLMLRYRRTRRTPSRP